MVFFFAVLLNLCYLCLQIPTALQRAQRQMAGLVARDVQPFIGGGVPRGELAGEGDIGLGVDGADVRYR